MNPAPVEWLDSVDSTNAEGLRRLSAGDLRPVWLASDNQWAGRGRRGRTWEDGGSGNLAASLVLTSHRPAGDIAQLSLVAAVAVADMIAPLVPADPVQLKWPNDVLIDGAKLVGILIESSQVAPGLIGAVIGIGINLGYAPPIEGRATTCLRRHAPLVPAPRHAAESLAGCFARRLAQWETHGLAPLCAAWTERAIGLGQACTARLVDATLEGIALGLDADGALRLQLPSGEITRISAGEVFFGAPNAACN